MRERSLPPPPLLPITIQEYQKLSNIKISEANIKNDLRKSLLLQNTAKNFNSMLQHFIFELHLDNLTIDPMYAMKILCMYDCDIDLAHKYIQYQLHKK